MDLSRDKTRFEDHYALSRLPWFEIRDGRLVLKDRSLGPIVDVHTHLALSYVYRTTVDLEAAQRGVGLGDGPGRIDEVVGDALLVAEGVTAQLHDPEVGAKARLAAEHVSRIAFEGLAGVFPAESTRCLSGEKWKLSQA